MWSEIAIFLGAVLVGVLFVFFGAIAILAAMLRSEARKAREHQEALVKAVQKLGDTGVQP